MYGKTNAFGTLTGILTGVVTDYASGSLLSGVNVSFNGTTQTTQSNGVYRYKMKPVVSNLSFTKTDYAPQTFPNVEIKRGRVKKINVVLEKYTSGTLVVKVTDATYDRPISGATVRYGSYVRYTDPSGECTFQYSAMTNDLTVSKEGYVDVIRDNVKIVLGEERKIKISLSPEGNYAYQMVLTWFTSPSDLDSHLITPSNFDLDYRRKKANYGADADPSEYTIDNCWLDVDETGGYGPETLTINQLDANGSYLYYVYQYSSSGELAGCGATVSISRRGYSSTLNYTVASSGTGRYWVVFLLHKGQYYEINRIVSDPPTKQTYIDEFNLS